MRLNFLFSFLFILGCQPALAQTYIKPPALIEGFSEIATSAGTTTLTKDSQTNQFFSGTSTQTVVLPDALTIPLGRAFVIQNKSTGALTVNTNGGGLLTTVEPNSQVRVTVTNVGSSAGVWNVSTSGGLTGILGVDKGGTGLDGSSAANGSLLIGNGTGYSLSTLTGTTNQVSVTNGAGSITLSTPQDIATTSSPEFEGLTLSDLTAGIVKSDAGGVLSSGSVSLTTEVTGILPLANGGTNKNMTAVAGGMIYSDADSLEVLAAGTSGYLLQSNGSSAPSWISSATLLDTTYFKQGGNSFTANGVLGTNDTFGLVLETDNVQRVLISSGGLVAIGSSTPAASAKLDIQGTDGALLIPRLTTTQKNALTPAAGMMVYDTTLGRFECYTSSWAACGSTDLQNSDLTLTASDTIAISTNSGLQTWLVQGSASSVTMSSTPFGTSAPVSGAEITVIGNDDTFTVTFPVNDAAKGIIGYQVTLGKGQVVTYKYNSTLDRYVIKSFSN